MKVKDKEEPFDDRGKFRVFVYGTLKTTRYNNYLLTETGARLLGRDSITGHFKLMDFGGYPCAYRKREIEVGADPMKIYGEVWAGTKETREALDMLEGHPDHFERIKVWSDLLQKRVWVYTQHEPKGGPTYGSRLTTGAWNPNDAEISFWAQRGAKLEPKSAE